MLRKILADGKAEAEFIEDMRKRGEETDAKVTASANEIISAVRNRGDAAIREYTMRFDGVEVSEPEVSAEEIEEGIRLTGDELMRILKRAAENIREYHKLQLSHGYIKVDGDTFCGQVVRGLERVGIYVPGGTAAYPSSVLMNAIPAAVAGVKEIVMATPPGKDGKVSPAILAAAKIAGVGRIYKMGGAQAVAALAYGTESVPAVDKIVGPGNIYVATAKRLVYGKVDIDMIAGPSEVLIVADETAEAKYLAADLMSQAEHDRLSSAVLVCTSESLADRVDEELKR